MITIVILIFYFGLVVFSFCPVHPHFSKNQTILLISSNYDYRSVLLNYLKAVENATNNTVTYHSFIILALDNKTQHWCDLRGIPSYLLSPSKNESTAYSKLSMIWIERFRILRNCLLEGYRVLMNDIDAIWHADPRPYLLELDKTYSADIITQRSSFPGKIFRTWGSSPCFGFIYFVPTQRVLHFLEFVMHLMVSEKTHDDQIALSNALLHLARNHSVHFYGHQWTEYEKNSSCGAHLCFKTSTSEAIADVADLTIVFLPHSKVPRLCSKKNSGGDKPLVSHCRISAKNGYEKKSHLLHWNHWFLEEEALEMT
eukprot:gene21-3417_t